MSQCIQIKNELSWEKHFYYLSLLRLKWKQNNIHESPYVSEVPCEFILAQSLTELNLKKDIIVRDGALDLYHFFKQTQPKNIRTQLIISQNLKNLVPKSWQKKILLYHLYCTTACRPDFPILLYGSTEGLPKEYIFQLTSLQQQGEISLWLTNNPKSSKDFPIVQTGQAIAEISLHLRTADSYITHKLLSQGAALYSQKSPLASGRKIPVSPYHGFIVTPFFN